MTESYYNLRGLHEFNRKRVNIAETLNLILERTNALETYLGQSLSSWYGRDPNTGVTYGNPALAEWPHMRIDYTGAPERCYICDRVDQLREILGAPAFPWKYAPTIAHFDSGTLAQCGVDARGWLEMLQAIGRPIDTTTAKKRYIRHWEQNENGTITTWDDPISTTAAASYYLREDHPLTQFTQRKEAWWGFGTINISTETGTFDLSLNELGTGHTSLKRTSWSEYIDTITGGTDGGEYDWVEEEGAEFVEVIAAGGRTPILALSRTLTGDYGEDGEYNYSLTGKCHGYYSIAEDANDHNITDLDVSKSGEETIGTNGTLSFTPTVSTSENGDITISVPDLNIGSLETDAGIYDGLFADMAGLIETYKDHVSVEHLRSVYDHQPHGDHPGQCYAAWGTALLTVSGQIGIARTVDAVYKTEDDSTGVTGWLTWRQYYQPSGWEGSLKI